MKIKNITDFVDFKITRLARVYPNEIEIKSLDDIRAVGGDVISTPGLGNHSTVINTNNIAASRLPWQVIKNPNPSKK